MKNYRLIKLFRPAQLVAKVLKHPRLSAPAGNNRLDALKQTVKEVQQSVANLAKHAHIRGRTEHLARNARVLNKLASHVGGNLVLDIGLGDAGDSLPRRKLSDNSEQQSEFFI